MKPCEQPCPKCGSDDINREFYARGARYSGRVTSYGAFLPGFGGTTGWDRHAMRDLIFNHCRTCQYEWDSKPLPKPKKQKAADQA